MSTVNFDMEPRYTKDINVISRPYEWINVKDKLPPEFKEVMFFYQIYMDFKQEKEVVKKDIVCGHYANKIWHVCYLWHSIALRDCVHVTHWMPLPENPDAPV